MRLTLTAAAALTGLCAVLTAPAAAAQPDPPPGPPPGPSQGTAIDEDGTYAVGADIAPGVYQSAGPIDGGACYWKRTAGDELVDNALTKKPAVVHIEATDTSFTTSDCQSWQLTNLPPPPEPAPGDLMGQLSALIANGMLSGGPR
ncbi:hypothetical protein [uncultured Mycolicibacterium sp.]|uniref:hypothetical protein n=1 Tax=uncultured Mycolicibacterium sp. TaxID=2320817 RepID=UPI0032B27A75